MIVVVGDSDWRLNRGTESQSLWRSGEEIICLERLHTERHSWCSQASVCNATRDSSLETLGGKSQFSSKSLNQVQDKSWVSGKWVWTETQGCESKSVLESRGRESESVLESRGCESESGLESQGHESESVLESWGYEIWLPSQSRVSLGCKSLWHCLRQGLSLEFSHDQLFPQWGKILFYSHISIFRLCLDCSLPNK